MDTEITKRVRLLYEADDKAKGLFDWLASRTNDVAETSIERICGMVDLERWQAIELAKSLAAISICDFIVGRKGWKSRVRWHYSVRSLGQAARGEAVKIEEIDPELAEEAADQQLVSEETEPKQEVGLSLAEAKRGLAVTFGVKPEAIEIIIRG
jgi:hypothetical protein